MAQQSLSQNRQGRLQNADGWAVSLEPFHQEVVSVSGAAGMVQTWVFLTPLWQSDAQAG